MKITKKYVVTLIMIILSFPVLQAQYGYGNRNRNGRQRNAIPQAQESPKKEEPLTAEQIVSVEMPNISEQLNLNEFEKAVVSTTLVKYLKQRMELQLLKLTPEKTREGMERIFKEQDEELKNGLPEEKFNAFIDLRKDGFKKKKGKKKKKKKKSR